MHTVHLDLTAPKTGEEASMMLKRARLLAKRVALVAALSAAATVAALTASPAQAAESAYQPLLPATSAANTNYVKSSAFQQPGSDRMLNPQPLPPKQFTIPSIFGR
jgi:hypothetical protein